MDAFHIITSKIVLTFNKVGKKLKLKIKNIFCYIPIRQGSSWQARRGFVLYPGAIQKEGTMGGMVMAVCISSVRGVKKQEVPGRIRIVAGYGIEGDAHGGNWHRQISLLSYEKIVAFNCCGAAVGPGDFGENIVVSGLDLRTLPVGTRLRLSNTLLEVTQIGKDCHNHCTIYQRVGDCIMPREGIFAKVIEAGTVAKGDSIEVI
jgi:MOSC domain-containing protein YiiM